MEQPKLDIGKIRDRVADIQGSVGELRELTSQPLDTFVADKRNVYATAHLFLVAIEAVASICNHILSRLARRAPGSYDECFQSLAELRIVPNPLAEALVAIYWFAGTGSSVATSSTSTKKPTCPFSTSSCVT